MGHPVAGFFFSLTNSLDLQEVYDVGQHDDHGVPLPGLPLHLLRIPLLVQHQPSQSQYNETVSFLLRQKMKNIIFFGTVYV